MISLILGALTSRAAGPLAASIALALLVSTGCQTIRLKAVENDLESAETQLASVQDQYDRCQTNREGLEAAVKAQNENVEAFARMQNERVAQAEKAALVAAKGRVDAELRAAKLLKSQPQGVDACSRFMSADRAVLDSLR